LISKAILTLTALFLILLGVALNFLPQETAVLLGLPGSPALTAVLQCLAGALIGVGFLNWFSRGNPMGGIYSRPLAMANLLLFAIGALSLLRAAAHASQPLQISAAVASVFAVVFAWVIFFHDPTGSKKQP
jgi:hypothetical protein